MQSVQFVGFLSPPLRRLPICRRFVEISSTSTLNMQIFSLTPPTPSHISRIIWIGLRRKTINRFENPFASSRVHNTTWTLLLLEKWTWTNFDFDVCSPVSSRDTCIQSHVRFTVARAVATLSSSHYSSTFLVLPMTRFILSFCTRKREETVSANRQKITFVAQWSVAAL